MTAKTPEQLVSVYGDMVYRLAYAQTRSRHDADDIFQEVFLQTVRKRPVFDSVEHEKAWLLRVTLNCLKSHWRMAWRRHDTPLDDRIPFPEPEDSALDEALRRLEAELEAARHMNTPLLKLIHGYGSSGKGGRIRTASRKYLLAQQEKGRIAAVVPGERFTIFDETTRRALQQYPHLRQDRDLERENMGVTFVFMRRF